MEALLLTAGNVRFSPGTMNTSCRAQRVACSSNAQALDSTADDPALIVEVRTVGEGSMATLRACIAALETISELREARNVAGLQMLQRVLNEALGVPDVRVRNPRWL
jgi:hypothetical protein